MMTLEFAPIRATCGLSGNPPFLGPISDPPPLSVSQRYWKVCLHLQ